MSHRAFENLLEHLSPPEQQRILRLAAESGISLEDPAWMGLAITERGIIVLEERLAALLQAAEAQRRQHWQTAEQELIERRRALVTRDSGRGASGAVVGSNGGPAGDAHLAHPDGG